MNRSQRPYQESNKCMNSQSLSKAAATKKLVEQQADLAQEAVLGSFAIFFKQCSDLAREFKYKVFQVNFTVLYKLFVIGRCQYV